MRDSRNLLLRWLFMALGVALAERIVPGIVCRDGWTLLLVVVLLGLFNAFLKPLLVLFTLPFVVATMGLGLWAINAFLLWGAGRLVDGFEVRGVRAALLGSLIISLTNLAMAVLFRARHPTPPRPPRPPAGRGDVIDI